MLNDLRGPLAVAAAAAAVPALVLPSCLNLFELA